MISQELIAKQRREGMRWNIINTLNKARPHTTSETFLLDGHHERDLSANHRTGATPTT